MNKSLQGLTRLAGLQHRERALTEAKNIDFARAQHEHDEHEPSSWGPRWWRHDDDAERESSSAGRSSTHSDLKRRLDTYIYDYFLKNGHHEHARALYHDASIELNTNPHPKSSPGRRRDGEMNGMDDSMDADSKDDLHKIPDDLPKPDVPDNAQGGFLYDWFGLFLDIYSASHNKRPEEGTVAAQYLQQTQV